MYLYINNYFLYLFLTSILLCSCSSNTTAPPLESGVFNKESIASDTVLTLHTNGSFVMAGSSDGLFRKSLDRPSAEWSLSGLDIDSASVVDLVFLDGEELMAAVLYDEVRNQKPTLFRSTDSGESWNPVEVNVPQELTYFVVRDLEVQANNPSNVFAYAGRILKSEDGGTNWSIVYEEGGVSEFLTVSPHHPDQVWTGGWTNIFSPYLASSNDNGNNWTLLNNKVYNGGDASCYDAILHTENPSQIMIGMSIGIQRSVDEGASWANVFNQASISTLAHSIQSPGTVYASGTSQQGTVFFAKSPNFGESWEIIEFVDGPAGVTVNDMVAVEINGQEVLYLGTDHGLYSYAFEE